MEADHPRFEDALAAVDAGDVEALKHLLSEFPDLVHARVTGTEAPFYDGYFHGATLLHHVAGNPIRGELPDPVVEVARALLEAGADPNAGCGGGPNQPTTAGGTVLGLVVTGAQAHIQGYTEPLIDLLLDHGAELDRSQGMFGTLYHTVEHQGQREVARMLYDRGVEADLPTAAGLGRLDLVRSFFEDDGSLVEGADRIWRDAPGDGTPGTREDVLADALLAACVNGWPEVVVELLGRGAPIDAVRKWGPFPVTPLHGAAWAGWPDLVTLLLERGADATVREPTYGGTPLGWAQHVDRPECVAVLQDRPDAQDPLGAFREAVEAEDVARVRRLLHRYPSVREAIDEPAFSFAQPALVFASFRTNPELMNALLDGGADVDARSDWDAGGFTALHHQVGGTTDPKPALARLLLDRGATIDLHAAAGLGRTDLLDSFLAEAPERVNEPGPDGTAPLHWARDPETARWLLDRGARIEQRCVDHNSTPAMWAIGERPEVLRFLVDQGARPDLFMAAVLDDVDLAARILDEDPAAIRVQTREGDFAHPPNGGDIYIWQLDFVDTPHEVARQRGSESVYRYLVDRSPPGIQLVQAAREGKPDRMREVLRAHPGALSGLPRQRHWDLMCQAPEALAVAVEHGGDVNIANRDGVTPLHQAAWEGRVDAVRWLVEHGADPRVRDTAHASTPLGWADFNGKPEVVEYLKAHTEPDIVDATIMGLTEKVLDMLDSDPALALGFPGASPLRAAAYMGNRTLVDALLAAGADPGDPNPETGQLAVDIARQRGHGDIVALLETWKGSEE